MNRQLVHCRNGLSDKEVLYFYNLLFRYETKISKAPKGYNYHRKEVGKFFRKNAIKLEYRTKKIQVHNEKNTIYFTSHTSICVDFIRHVRNAFAHGLLSKEKNIYIIQDLDKGKYTTYGRIGQNLLVELISVLENTKDKVLP